MPFTFCSTFLVAPVVIAAFTTRRLLAGVVARLTAHSMRQPAFLAFLAQSTFALVGFINTGGRLV